MREIIEILGDYDTPEANEWRERLRHFYFDQDKKVPRSDVLLYATGNAPAGRGGRSSWLALNVPETDYTGRRSLEVIEVHLSDPAALVKSLYRPTP